MLCLGDTVGYGADPLACVELVAERARGDRGRQPRARGGRAASTSTGSTATRGPRPSGRASGWTTTIAAWLGALPLVARGGRRHAGARLAGPARGVGLPGHRRGRLRRVRRLRDAAVLRRATRHVPGAWSLGSSGPEHSTRARVDVDARARAGATSSTSAASASRATAIRARPTRMWDVEAGRVADPPRRLRRRGRAPEDPRGRVAALPRRSPGGGRLTPCARHLGPTALLVGSAGVLGAGVPADGLGRRGLDRAGAAAHRRARPARPRMAFAWGWLFGIVFFLVLLRWLNFTFRTFSAIPWPLTWGPTLLLSAWCGLYIGAVVAGVMAWLPGGARRRGRSPPRRSSGSAASGCAATCSAASRGARSATRSTCACRSSRSPSSAACTRSRSWWSP